MAMSLCTVSWLRTLRFFCSQTQSPSPTRRALLVSEPKHTTTLSILQPHKLVVEAVKAKTLSCVLLAPMVYAEVSMEWLPAGDIRMRPAAECRALGERQSDRKRAGQQEGYGFVCDGTRDTSKGRQALSWQ